MQMKVSDFMFDSVHLLWYKRHKINFKHGGSFIDFPACTKNKISEINLIIKKKDNKCFQYAVTVALSLK